MRVDEAWVLQEQQVQSFVVVVALAAVRAELRKTLNLEHVALVVEWPLTKYQRDDFKFTFVLTGCRHLYMCLYLRLRWLGWQVRGD